MCSVCLWWVWNKRKKRNGKKEQIKNIVQHGKNSFKKTFKIVVEGTCVTKARFICVRWKIKNFTLKTCRKWHKKGHTYVRV